MSASKRKLALSAVVAVLLMASLACMNSNNGGNNGGDTGGNDGPDFQATEDALAATQAAIDQPEEEPPTEVPPTEAPPPPPPPSGGDEPAPAPSGGIGDVNWAALESGDIIYTTEFDSGGDWEEGWIHFALVGSDNYDAYTYGDVMYTGLWDTDTYLYLVLEDLWIPRDNSDYIVGAYFDNVGDVRNNNIGVFCRGSADGWYEFVLSSSGLWYIYKYDANDGYSLLANGGVQGYDSRVSDYMVAASCIGENLTIYIDGNMPTNGQATDRAFREGQVGFTISSFNVPDVEVEVDWFEVIVP